MKIKRNLINLSVIIAMGLGIFTANPSQAYPNVNSWKSVASMPLPKANFGAAAASNGKVYVIGGETNWVIGGTVNEYDPVTNTWTAKAEMLAPRHNLGVVTAGNGKIYAIGGRLSGDVITGANEEYDPLTNTWTAKASMPTPRYCLGVAAVGNKIYAIGGVSAQGPYSYFATVEEYDITTNTWTTKKSMSAARGYLAAAAGGNGKIYAIGGGGPLATVEEYDPSANTWLAKANMITAVQQLSAVAGSSGKIYAIGGEATGGYSSAVQEYDPGTNTWAAMPPMPTPRTGLDSALASNGKIYAFGGVNNAGYSATVEEFTHTVYVALGDSFSSGEGNPEPPYEPGTDGPVNYCHRSSKAYSQILTDTYGLDLKFYACSGAVTGDVTANSRYGELAQLRHPEVSSAGLITMTIGGNDAGFADVLIACIAQKLKADAHNEEIGQVALWLGFGLDPSCANYQEFVDDVNRKIDNVYPFVLDTYREIRKINPSAKLVVANYPYLFPDPSSGDQGCESLSLWVTKDNQNFFNTATKKLDGVLEEAALQAGVKLIDVRDHFNEHAICGNKGAWINGMSIASVSQCTFSVFGKCIIDKHMISGSFHPNASGHSDGYAAAFKEYLDSPAANSPQSVQTNSLAAPKRPATTTAPAVDIRTLTTQAVTAGTAACEGTYQADQQVLVSGEGFAPGASVRVFVTSPGLDSANEEQVGQLTADSAGLVTDAIRIPPNATGFTPAGSLAGLVFIDAIGLGPDGAHVDNVAMLGLAPHSSDCGTVDPYMQFLPSIRH